MRYNFKYGKLENNQLCYAPNILVVGNEQIINAPAETYKVQGYLPIVKTDIPEADENCYYTPIYTESDGKIIQQWKKVEYEPEATETDYINALEDLGVNFNG